ncbi:GH92 family glycosyl hydrolase [Agromyces sp. NPDC057679]|uniref:GH92 family glycosyl hydrolase n=1 Tax=Agromyces sp. NPDC057679 TaxID=3346207 RepID=UPI00366BE337
MKRQGATVKHFNRSGSARRTRATATAVITMAMAAAALTPISAAAAAPGEVTFQSSFEAGDAVPALAGTGESVNLSGDRNVPGSLLPQVTAVTASGQNPPNETAEKLADANPGSKWLVFSATGWAQYELAEARPIEAYTLTSGNDAPERDPRDFKVLGSNNGTDWTVVDTRSGESFSARGQTRSFALPAPSAAYRYYRLDITANHSGGLIQLAGWEPIADADAEPTPTDLALEVDSGPTSSYTAKTNVGFSGTHALRYAGTHLGAGPAASTSVIYSDLDIAVEEDSRLSYTVFPVLDSGQSYASTFVAIDLVLDDGTTLAASELTDSYGYGADARSQGLANVLWPDQWNKVSVDLGALAGRTVTGVLLDYDHPGDGVTGVETPAAGTTVLGWLDDIRIEEAEPHDDSDGLVSYVDTRRGTNSTGGFSRGNNIPAVGWPNGFNFITPMTNADNTGTLYQYQGANTAQNLPALEGIGFSHQPSIWMGDRNQLAVLPAVGANPTSTLDDRRLTFHHENEVARPDVYGVEFDNGISTEVTATDHGAVYRFAFTGDQSSVIVDQLVNSSKLTITGDTVTGWVDGGSGYPGRTRMFVYGTFDAQPTKAGPTTQGNRNGSARFAAFDTSSDRTVELRIASSFISQQQAQRNHELELAGVSFDDAHAAVRDAWNDRLGVVHDVQGATETQLVTLYSSLYRLNLYPNSQFENVGTAGDPEYKYASPVSATTGAATDTTTNAKLVDGKIYVNNGFWDTYRTAWPLYSLLYPDVTEELVDGFVQQYRDGGWIARWSSPGYADLMTGTSSDVAFAEAYLAGALDTDTALEAYDAAVKNATVLPASNAVGRKGLAQSIFLGYTEESTHESASWGLEGFINDFGIGEMAAALADDPNTPADRVERLLEEAEYFQARASHYVEMFNPEADTFTARNADGSWPVGADFDQKAWGGAFTEASAKTFGFHAPHDVAGLAALYGGRQGLIEELDEFLTVREKADYSGIHEAREARDVRLGMLGMSNQVAHHIPYVLAEAGDPAEAQALIRDIQQRLFVGSDIGQGYPGDEDNGEFSAWYVFSALGLYPLEVGSGDYTIGTPLFDRATLSIGDSELVISAPGASDGKAFVSGVELNGTPVDETTLDGDLLREGGELVFAMSDEPSEWGAKDLGEQLEVPRTLVDATKVDRGTLSAGDGTSTASLVDDSMNTTTTFDSGTAELTWTSQSGPVTVGQYTLTGAALDRAPASWTLSGSTDGENWTELDHRDGESFDWATQTRPFSIDADGVFTSLRLSVESADGPLTLSEVELFASAGTAEGLTVSPAAAQSAAVDTEFAGPLATIVGTETSASGYQVSVDYGDGTGTVEGTLKRDDLGGWRVTAPHTFTAPGLYTATVIVQDSTGALASASTNVAVTRDETFVGSFDSTCIGDLGTTAANCDGQGFGYFRDKLAADGFVQGSTIAIPGTALSYDLPAVAAGKPDNLTGEGQTVRLGLGEGATQLAFVGTATENGRQPEAVLHFTDGTSQTVKISFGDWVGASGNPAFGNSVVAISEGRLSGTAAESSVKNTAIYATAPITIDTDDAGAPKVVESLTMPAEEGTLRDGRVHVFAVASDGDRSGASALEVQPQAVEAQIAAQAFEATLATTVGGASEQSAIVNWGDGTPVSALPVTEGAVTGGHTYAVSGSYTVSVTVDDGVRSASTTLEIVVDEPAPVYTPEIAVEPAQAAPGGTIRVTGDGFAPGETVELRFDGGDPVSTTSTAAGAIDDELTIPAGVVDGDYAVTAVGAVSAVEASAPVAVRTPARATTVTLGSDAEAPVAGDLVGLNATVAPSEATGLVEILEGETVVGTATVTAGTATADVRVETSGLHTYTARFVPDSPESYLPSVSEPFAIEVGDAPVEPAELTLSDDSAAQGGTLGIAGTGFGPGELVTIRLHSEPVRLAEVAADDHGAFEAQVTIPATAAVGEHTIVAEGAVSGLSAQAVLTVTATTVEVATISIGAPNKLLAKAGSAIRFTARVFALDGRAPVGTFTVYDGDRAIAEVPVTARDGGEVTVKLPKLKGGLHLIHGEFEGDAGYGDSRTIPVPLLLW